MPTPDPLLDRDRLTAIEELGMGGEGQLEVFGHLNDLAQQLLDAPISVVSLVTGDRHVSAGQAGLSEDRVSRLELPHTHALCTQVTASGEALIIEDTSTHPVSRDHLGVRDLGIAAYAGAPLRLSGGEVVGAFCAIDTSPRRWSPQQLQVLSKLTAIAATLLDQRRQLNAGALRDVVTGLPRLGLFHERLRELLVAAEPHEQVVTVAVDICDFALLNDAWGQVAGDAVLADVGLRLEHLVNRRRVAGTVCRLAADTFLVSVLTHRAEAREQLERDVLSAVIGRPVRHGDHEQQLAARAATVVATTHGAPQQITDDAKSAVRAAARRHHDVGSPQQKQRRLMIRNRLWDAEARDELSLHYQPICDLQDDSIVGFEALLRWNNGDLGPVPPNEFIPEAERSGAIVPIGEWVLRQGLADLMTWRSNSRRPLTLSVNVAPEQLLIPTFADLIARELQRAGLPGSALIVEVTERTLGDESPAMNQTLHALRAAGVRISVDDFGTGYSSLSRLAQLPLDELKIDRSFVAQIETDERCRDLVASVIAMATTLGLTPLAEGIETRTQHQILKQLGCALAQGYLLARPAPAATLTEHLVAR